MGDDAKNPSQDYLDWIRTYKRWYTGSVALWHVVMLFCRITLVASITISAITSAIVDQQQFAAYGKYIIVISSVLSTFSYAVMAQFRVREMLNLRELGRVEMASLYSYAKDKFCEFAGDREKIFKLKDELREKIFAVERAQGREFADIFLSTDEKKPD